MGILCDLRETSKALHDPFCDLEKTLTPPGGSWAAPGVAKLTSIPSKNTAKGPERSAGVRRSLRVASLLARRILLLSSSSAAAAA